MTHEKSTAYTASASFIPWRCRYNQSCATYHIWQRTEPPAPTLAAITAEEKDALANKLPVHPLNWPDSCSSSMVKRTCPIPPPMVCAAAAAAQQSDATPRSMPVSASWPTSTYRHRSSDSNLFNHYVPILELAWPSYEGTFRSCMSPVRV